MSLRPPYFFHISDLSSFLPVVQSFVPWVLAPPPLPVETRLTSRRIRRLDRRVPPSSPPFPQYLQPQPRLQRLLRSPRRCRCLPSPS